MAATVGIALVSGIAAFATRRQDLDDDQLHRVTSWAMSDLMAKEAKFGRDTLDNGQPRRRWSSGNYLPAVGAAKLRPGTKTPA